MGGFFGAISHRDCVLDIFFGVDYHSHLGTRRGGMAVYGGDGTFQRHFLSVFGERPRYSAASVSFMSVICMRPPCYSHVSDVFDTGYAACYIRWYPVVKP